MTMMSEPGSIIRGALQRGDRVRRRSGGPEGTILKVHTDAWHGPLPPSRWRAKVRWHGNVRHLSGRTDQASTLLLSQLQPAAAPVVRHVRRLQAAGTWVHFRRPDGYARICAYYDWGRRHRTLCGVTVEVEAAWEWADPDRGARLTPGGDLAAVNCVWCQRNLALAAEAAGTLPIGADEAAVGAVSR